MLTAWRDRLADELAPLDEMPLPLPIPDKWIGHSAIHKAIRRGDADLAGAAALALLTLDRSGLWRTLLTTGFEDVGIGDEAAMIATAAGAENFSWRTKVGEDRVAVTIARTLAEAVKDRSADNLICAVRTHPGLEEYRRMAGEHSIPERLRMVGDETLPLEARATAAWYVSGVEWWPERRVGKGDRNGLFDVYRSLGASADLVEATAVAARRVGQPIVLMPALLSAALGNTPSETATWEPPSAPLINGLPPCVLDRFTRVGKAAITRFVQESEPVRNVLDGLVPDKRWTAVGAYGVFHAEGSKLIKRRIHREALRLDALGREADFLPEGIGPADFTRLIETVEAELPALNEIRARLAGRTCLPAQGQLL